MFRNKTRKRIKEHNWNDHSNTSQFFSRIEEQTDDAIKDLTLVANNLNEKQLEEISNWIGRTTTILVFNHPWNKSLNIKDHFKRVYSWENILEQIG